MNKVEEVARAIEQDMSRFKIQGRPLPISRREWGQVARAAIEAMKGANEHMVSVGDGYLYGTIEPAAMFDAMLQAALDEADE